MTCEEALLCLSGHLDHENTAEEEAQLRAHLETCPQCAQLLRILRENDEKLKTLEAEPPRELKDNIMEAIRREAAPRKKAPRRAWATVAVAAALVLVVGNGILRQIQKAAIPTAKETRETEDPSVNAALVDAQNRIAAFAAPTALKPLSDEECQALADEYGAPVVVLLDSKVEDIPELVAASVCTPAYSVEESDSTYCMYTLGTAHAAEDLYAEYGGELYLPMADLQKSMPVTEDFGGVSYVLLAGN